VLLRRASRSLRQRRVRARPTKCAFAYAARIWLVGRRSPRVAALAMQKKVVSALVSGAWVAFVMSGCSGDKRNFERGNAGGAQNAGTSGGGVQARGGSEAEGGRRALAGMGGVDDGSGAASGGSGVAGVGGEAGASGETGAGGEAGASCQDGECGSCGNAQNVCGGCGVIAGTLGASCGACSVTACASDKNSLVCNSQCSGAQVCVSGLNQCKTPDCSAADSCGKSDGAASTCTNTKGNCLVKPNSTGQCAGASCAYTCKTKP